MSSNISDDKNEQEYKQQITQLEKSLEYARLKILGLETMIKVAEEDLQIKIRKKPGTKRSKE
jgi:2-iminoacetate synthase ThiH